MSLEEVSTDDVSCVYAAKGLGRHLRINKPKLSLTARFSQLSFAGRFFKRERPPSYCNSSQLRKFYEASGLDNEESQRAFTVALWIGQGLFGDIFFRRRFPSHIPQTNDDIKKYYGSIKPRVVSFTRFEQLVEKNVLRGIYHLQDELYRDCNVVPKKDAERLVVPDNDGNIISFEKYKKRRVLVNPEFKDAAKQWVLDEVYARITNGADLLLLDWMKVASLPRDKNMAVYVERKDPFQGLL